MRGLFVATLTPFDADFHVDPGVVRDHAAWLVDNGVEGLCPVGTTGEFLYLSAKEKRSIYEATVAGAAGRVPVIAGVWDRTLGEIANNVHAAAEARASAVFLPPPIYYQLTDRVNVAFYERVARFQLDAPILPVFAYNIPQSSGNEITLSAFRAIVDAGYVVGLKDSSGKRDRFEALVREFGDRTTLFAASDSFLVTGRSLGAHGFISAIANAFPELFVRLWRGDDSLQPKVDALRAALKHVGSIAGLKYLVLRSGFEFGGTRLPLSPINELTSDDRTALNAAVESLLT